MVKKHAFEIVRIQHNGNIYQIPLPVLNKYISVTEEDTIRLHDDANVMGAKYLRRLRLEAGYNYTQLARLAGIDQSDIRKMELGKLSIGKTRAMRLAKVFNINFFSLISIPK